MVERLGEMRKGRRDRIEKGSREGIEKRERQFEEKEGLRAPPPPPFLEIRSCDVAIVSSSPQGMTSWSSSIKIWFLQAYRMHYSKKCHGVKQSFGETECNET